MKLEEYIKNNKHTGTPTPKRGRSFETFEKWFCREFNIKPIEVHQKHYKL